MSDDGMTPAAFHRLPGADDWRVTSRGAEAVFRADSLAHGSTLVPGVVAEAESAGIVPDVDLRPEAVVVRVAFAGDALPTAAGSFAAAVSVAARDLGLSPDPGAVQSVDVYVAEHSDVATRPFWTAVLGYREHGETDAVDPLRRGPQLAFNPIRGDRPGRGRTHVDVHVPAGTAVARIEAALAAGGRLVDDSHAPAWWTLASPDNHGVDLAEWIDSWDG